MAINNHYTDDFQILKCLYGGESNTGADNDFFKANSQFVRDPFQVVQLKQFVHDDSILSSLMEIISKIGMQFVYVKILMIIIN